MISCGPRSPPPWGSIATSSTPEAAAEASTIVERPRNEPISTIRPPAADTPAASHRQRACASVSQPSTPSSRASTAAKPSTAGRAVRPATELTPGPAGGAAARLRGGGGLPLTTASVVAAVRSQVNVSARASAAAPSRVAQLVVLEQVPDAAASGRRDRAASMPVSPSTIDSRRPPTASAALGVPHSAASITVSDQPSDAEAVTCTQAWR